MQTDKKHLTAEAFKGNFAFANVVRASRTPKQLGEIEACSCMDSGILNRKPKNKEATNSSDG